jgi:hypothetical protein
MPHKCHWVLSPAKKGVDAVYCDKKVGYRIVKDDDFNNVREYNPFCQEHMAEYNAHPEYSEDALELDIPGISDETPEKEM